MTWNVLVSTGYCEEASNGWIWFNYNPPRQTTPYQARGFLKQVFFDYFHKMSEEANKIMREGHKCKGYTPNTNFCSQCGVQMYFPMTDSDNEVVEIIRNLMTRPVDSVDQRLVEILEDAGWNIWGQPVNGKLVRFYSFDDWVEGRFHDPSDAEITVYEAQFEEEQDGETS